MKPRKPSEDDAAYIRRLEDANASLRAENRQLGKWVGKVERAVSWLAIDASLAFQVMAEKAGVRSHPSVSKAVELFDTIAHPQWTADDAKLPDLDFPTDWDLDPPNAWTGDADMELNTAIAKVLEYLDSRKFNGGLRKGEMEQVFELEHRLETALMGVVDGMFPPRASPPMPTEIPDSATRDDLARVIQEMSWRAFEIAEDMGVTNSMLRRDLRAGAYRRMCRDLCEIGRVSVRENDRQHDAEAIPF